MSKYGKEEIRSLLASRGIFHQWTEHEAAFTMTDESVLCLPHYADTAKNIFASDDKRRNYFLISIKGDRRVNLKEIGKNWGYKHLRFASPGEMEEILGLSPGSVSPLGLLNDMAHRTVFCLDSAYKDACIVVHPNENTASVYLKTADLLRLLSEKGTRICYFTPESGEIQAFRPEMFPLG